MCIVKNSIHSSNALYREPNGKQKYIALKESHDALLSALEDALPYVQRAYECAFPDEWENENVASSAKEAIEKAKTIKVIK